MNDRYLYRAKRKKWELFPEAQQWVQGYYVHTAESDYIVSPYEHTTLLGEGETVEIEVNTLCQCSEIGKEVGINSPVWENEIYQWEDAAYGKCTGIIRYGKYLQDGSGNEYPEIACYGFYVEVVKVEPYYGMDELNYPHYLKTISVLEMFMRNTGVTVIGNIFDNPELLGVGE